MLMQQSVLIFMYPGIALNPLAYRMPLFFLNISLKLVNLQFDM